MRGLYVFVTALLILLLAPPATSVTADTAYPAGSETPSATFNVVRLGLYPEESADQVFAVGNVAFLADNHYDSINPPDWYGAVELYDIADPQNPHFKREVTAAYGRTISDMDSDRCKCKRPSAQSK